ncbi:MAG: OmpH family outer membrane protein [Vicinamibacterales bacterium]|jgi:outer membrane protein|nr:OmpH family outer membrane protein [Vicinamibacterales bacterium]
MRRTVIATVLTLLTGVLPATAQEFQGIAFPTARVAFFDAQRVATESVTGQAAFAGLEAFRSETTIDLERRNQALAAERQRLQTESTVLSPTARLDLERQIQRSELDIQRLLEDAQTEFFGLQQEAENGFEVKLRPAVEAVALEQGVHFVFDRLTTPIIWADPAYDLTERIIERLDAN